MAKKNDAVIRDPWERELIARGPFGNGFVDKQQVRRGALRVQRHTVGMAPVRQDNDRTPTRRGWWVFPWPAVNHFYQWGKIREVQPRDLGGKRCWMKKEDRQLEWDDEKEARYAEWMKANGNRVMKFRSAWWSGPIYSHLGPDGSRSYDWFAYPDPAAWQKSVRRYLSRRRPWSPDIDDMELWLPVVPGHNNLLAKPR